MKGFCIYILNCLLFLLVAWLLLVVEIIEWSLSYLFLSLLSISISKYLYFCM
jgi:hypothetical protein